MRAQEFVTEAKRGHIPKRLQNATVGLNTFVDGNYADRSYELNRIMMAAAMADGSDKPLQIDAESWAGRNDIAAPYTEVEQKMMHQAFRAVGSKHQDLNHGDLQSQEHPAVNRSSPVKAFSGFR